jgi:hypothetical protein
MHNDTDDLLRQIIAELQGQNELLRTLTAETISNKQTLQNILQVDQSIDGYVSQIVNDLNPPFPTSFSIVQENIMVALAPGNTAVFTATPTPAGTALGPGIVAVFTSSDTVNAPVTADATGLIGTVVFPSTAVVGTSFTLTCTATNADGTVATGSASFTIVAAPSPDVTGFTIAQTT